MNKNQVNQIEDLELEYAELSDLELEAIAGGFSWLSSPMSGIHRGIGMLMDMNGSSSHNQRIGSGSGSNLGRGSGFAVIPGTLAINPFW